MQFICLGMQCAVVEFGRHVLGLKNASSTEMNEHTPHPVIAMMEEQKKVKNNFENLNRPQKVMS